MLSSHPDRVGRYTVKMDDGTVLRLYRQTVQDFGLYVGRELTNEEKGALLLAAGEMSAKMRAVRIVSASNVSKADLEQRLIQKGEDPRQAKHAVKWMADMDLLDDQKTAKQIVHRCISKGYGLVRAKQALYEKRIPKVYWDFALKDYPDQSDVILDFLRARLDENSDSKAVRKVIDALLRKGHSYSEIRNGLQKLSLETDSAEDC